MDMFRRSNRVRKHLENRLEETEQDQWNMNIVVRRWIEINPEYEFRAFVHNNTMTAITHYYKFLYVEEIVECKELIQNLILEFFEHTLKELVPLDDYVIDFIYDYSNQSVSVIELNPWSEASSSALFDWEVDQNIIFGEEPFQFRILEQPFADPLERVSARLKYMIFMYRPNSDIVRPKLENELFPKGKYASLFSSITKKFIITSEDIDIERLFQIIIEQPSFAHWVPDDQFFDIIQMRLESTGLLRNLFPTTIALVLIEIYFRNNKHAKTNEYVELCKKAYIYCFAIKEIAEDDENMDQYISNTCSFLSSIAQIIHRK
eukprot:TRINITY_DN3020_c0_g1_i1.p1 TRINITY_DN3020_c0_g1~~TRINITY_DN3020_c0_g1_i1.p1  ORF type:complete len:319 (+),score=68.93 TRINITY_DN3020_c0_g1_i1:439-1395(+)